MITYSEMKRNLILKCANENIPVLGVFELTSKCNFKLFIKDVNENLIELKTEEWKTIFKDAVYSGLLYAVFIGGEVLIRKDFIELYEYLFDLGVKITLYTNGTLITPEMAYAFKIRPPELIVVTLYGVNNENYYKITKNRNGFTLVDQGINLLKKARVNTVLRILPIKKVYYQLDNIIKYVKKNNFSLEYFLCKEPKFLKNHIDSLLDPEEYQDYELKLIAAFGTGIIYNKDTTTCTALHSSYFVTCDGIMQPCENLNNPRQKIFDKGFLETWKYLSQEIKKIKKCEECFFNK